MTASARRAPLTESERRALRGLAATLLGAPTAFDAHALPLSLVRRHLIAPLAYAVGVAAFRTDHIASSLQAERRAAVATEALTALAAAGVPVILLKGIAYAGTLYPDPALRPMSDIDLLVRATDFITATRTLQRLGYWHTGGAAQLTVTRHALTLKRRDGSLDLHRHILHAGRSRIDLHAIWRDARPSHLPGALRPSPLHEYLLHVAHIGRHEGAVPLVNYIDASRLRALISPAEGDHLAAAWSISRSSTAVARAIEELRATTTPLSGPPLSFPSTDEIFALSPVPRWLQLIRKVRMVDDWRGLAGLAAATVRSRIAPLFRRTD